MGFPSSPFNKANVVAGQTSDPADVNDVYTELAAIGDGLINGTAPIHTSNAIVNNFSAGNSTLTDLLVTTATPTARVSQSAAFNLNSGSTTTLTFDTHEFVSPAGMHSTAVNASRLIPPSSGVYLIGANVDFGNSTVGQRDLGILIDGSSVIARTRTSANVIAGAATLMSVTTVYRFASTTQYAEAIALQTSGSTLSLSTAFILPTFWMTKVR